MHTNTHTHIYIYLNMYACKQVFTYVYDGIHTLTNICIHVCMYVPVFVCILNGALWTVAAGMWGGGASTLYWCANWYVLRVFNYFMHNFPVYVHLFATPCWIALTKLMNARMNEAVNECLNEKYKQCVHLICISINERRLNSELMTVGDS